MLHIFLFRLKFKPKFKINCLKNLLIFAAQLIAVHTVFSVMKSCNVIQSNHIQFETSNNKCVNGNEREWQLIYYYGREWECFYTLLWEWDGNGNMVMGMGGNGIEKVISAHLKTKVINYFLFWLCHFTYFDKGELNLSLS